MTLQEILDKIGDDLPPRCEAVIKVYKNADGGLERSVEIHDYWTECTISEEPKEVTPDFILKMIAESGFEGEAD